MQQSCFATLLPNSQGFLLVVVVEEAGRTMEANPRGAYHPEHAHALCLVKETLKPQRTQSMCPNLGQDVHSFKRLLNPEKACDLPPSTSAACPNLPKCPHRSLSSSLRPSCLMSSGHSRGERNSAGSRVI